MGLQKYMTLKRTRLLKQPNINEYICFPSTNQSSKFPFYFKHSCNKTATRSIHVPGVNLPAQLKSNNGLRGTFLSISFLVIYVRSSGVWRLSESQVFANTWSVAHLNDRAGRVNNEWGTYRNPLNKRKMHSRRSMKYTNCNTVHCSSKCSTSKLIIHDSMCKPGFERMIYCQSSLFGKIC